MDAPLLIAGIAFADAPSLYASVLEDSRKGGGSVVPGQRPSTWLATASRAGELSRAQVVGLSAALVQTGEPDAILEVAALAAALDLTELAPLLLAAHDALDLGVLLRADPRATGRSVEDALLECWASLASEAHPDNLRALLLRLRQAGLRDAELTALLRHGDAELLAAHLPSMLAEPTSEEEIARIHAARARGPEFASVLDGILASAPAAGVPGG